nr:hypothetical protein [Candidatus Sigynarchaeota archaeon]
MKIDLNVVWILLATGGVFILEILYFLSSGSFAVPAILGFP